MLSDDRDTSEQELFTRVRRVVRASRTSDASSLVTIQPHGSRLPLFGIHPGNGEVFFYRRLAPLLGPDQPVYGFRAGGLDGRTRALSRVEDFASAYVRDVVAVQPQGPYVLVGRCGGSKIAYEMAQQLSRMGQTVALLAVIDPGQIFPAGAIVNRVAGVARYLRYHAANGHLWPAIKVTMVRRVRLAQRRMERLAHAVRGDRTTQAGPDVASRRARATVRDALLSPSYTPAPYSGRILYFAAADAERHANPSESWARLAALDVVNVPGNHRTITATENLAVLAGHLRRHLDALATPAR